MGSGLERTEIIRRDCKACFGNGYLNKGQGEVACEACGGAGQEEKEVPFKFDGQRTQEEKEALWNS
jgi:DnaJ-class molecular chaperone